MLRFRIFVGLLLVIGFWILGLGSPALAAAPETCRIGAYVVALHDLNPTEGSFGTDYWVWSVCPSKTLTPLKQMDMVSSKLYATAYLSEQETKDRVGDFQALDKVYWSQQKVITTLRYDWDLRNFPFDRHVLAIPMEEAQYDTSKFVYTADTANSNYDRSIKIDGWEIKGFKVQVDQRPYNSTFGDPQLASSESAFSRFIISFDIQRSDFLDFLKLTAGAYAAFATVLLAFFLEAGDEIGGRTGLLVGSLFAILVSMQGVDSVLGSTAGLSLVNSIHVLALAFNFLAVITAVYSRLQYEQGREKWSLRFDRRICFPLFTISFVTVNGILIANAIVQG